MRLTFILFLIISLITAGCTNQSLSHKLTHHEFIQMNQPAILDSSVDAIIAPYRDSLNLSMNTVIGTSSASMRSFKPESPLSSFVADLVYDAGHHYLEAQGYSQSKLVALVNVRGLRAPMPEGPVLLRNAYEIMPFENLMTAVLLSGEQMQHFFQIIARENGDGISGATFTLTNEGATSIKIDGQPIQESEDYWVVTSDYLAEGGDGYTIFGESDTQLISNYTIRGLIIKHIKSMTQKNQIISPETEVRIRDIR
jgi:2',3'-cyclic-nucleotide 2'-phosphodiesterase (5'-nucleotidase family)